MLLPTTLLLILVGMLAGRAATFQTKAPYALLVDYNFGAVLFEKKADAPVAPASTTKILTGDLMEFGFRGPTR
jgi:serine-type D-Ala-D-Ala carboxypeptidase (penicillin-binding protein 5/6)